MDLSEYDVSVAAACEVTGVARSTFYRDKKPKERSGRRPRLKHPRALTSEQVEQVALVLNENKYVDRSPKAVKAALLDEGIYLCSERTMYRILHIRGELKERRSQRRHPVHKKPELMAKRPNKVWSWDISVPRTRRGGLHVEVNLFEQRCCIRDGGGSSGVGLPGLASNNHKRLRLRVVVVNVVEKALRCVMWDSRRLTQVNC